MLIVDEESKQALVARCLMGILGDKLEILGRGAYRRESSAGRGPHEAKLYWEPRASSHCQGLGPLC